jgi:CheY-like chemotaxis protein
LLAMTVLAKFGIQARLARDGVEALDMAREETFDVILMDVQMPRMDGIDATRAIRAMSAEQTQRPWIIAVTANAFDQDRERCLAAGMNDFVSKPFRQEALRDALMQSARRLGTR